MCIFCSSFLWSAPTKFSMIADHSFLLTDPKTEEKSTIVIFDELVYKRQGTFHCAGETQHMRMDTSQFVSKYLRTLWSEDCLSFWLSLNLNLRRRTVGKSESLLIPLPRASIDPFSWHFCMSALSTGGFCMTLYEYLLRLTWLTAHVCSHDNVLAIRFFHRSGTFC